MIKKSRYKIYDLLRKYLLATILFVTVLSSIGFSMISYFFIKTDRDFLNQQINILLSEVLVPSLEISDTTEVKRILNLASRNHHIVAVIDKNADIFIANYVNMGSIQNVLKASANEGCDALKGNTIKIDNQDYYISCYPLLANNKSRNLLGILLNLSPYNIFPFSVDVLLYTALLFFASMLLILIILRNVINKHVIAPISELKKDISQKIASPLEAKFEEGKSINSIDEIVIIRDSFAQLIHHLQAEYAKKIEIQKDSALYQLSRQLAHDIRSPLAALDMILQDLSQLPEESRIITRHAISRIRDIANNLLFQHEHNESSPDAVAVCLLTSLIDSLISEKRIQYRSKLNIQIEFSPEKECYGLFSQINPAEFKRILSNLINNSVEALGESGHVSICLKKHDQHAIISVIDNGPGMPDVVIRNLGCRGNTYGKSGGAGLGLSHAVNHLKHWGGKLHVESAPHQGTSVKIELPLTNAPDWFLKALNLKNDTCILILDDDSTIHQIWNDRFEKMELTKYGIKWYHFSNKSDISEWLRINNKARTLVVLCDYEFLGYPENGLEIIESLQLENCSILVTSRYEQSEIQVKCNQLKIPLLPKPLAPQVPINILTEQCNRTELFDLILLDDDPLIRTAWEFSAKLENKKIKTFSHFKELEQALPFFEKFIPIYLDYSLSEELTGTMVAEKLASMGFTELYLATGFEGYVNFQVPACIKKVVSKNFP
ncbi:MAG: HAMP domain-containing histidine kinase [Legionellales bacterium]|nr:HAMP domain-containing histidine kinase [Legionellales bacterium]